MRKIRQIILVFGDVFFAYASLLLTLFIGFWGKFGLETFIAHLLPFSFLYFSWLVIFYIFDLYELNLIKTKLSFYPRVLGAMVVNGVIGTILFYLVPIFGITPKTNLVLNLAFFGILILIWRKTFYLIFAERLLNNVAIVGQSQEAKQLAEEISARPYLGYNLKTIFKTNDVKNLFQKIKKQKIDTLIIAENLKTNSDITEALYKCIPARINILDLSRAYEIICKKIPVSFVEQTWFLENLREGERAISDKIKRIFDLLFALLLLIIGSPLCLIIALAVKLQDKGPVFYCHKRVGKDKKPFVLIKFRSMKQNAENGKAIWAKENDPRITKVGKIIRKTHLDELPQMLNVLKGDVSLVGPRPERPVFVNELEKQIPHYHLRHLIKPGVTGWAQIRFRYARTMLDGFNKFQYDLYYLKTEIYF